MFLMLYVYKKLFYLILIACFSGCISKDTSSPTSFNSQSTDNKPSPSDVGIQNDPIIKIAPHISPIPNQEIQSGTELVVSISVEDPDSASVSLSVSSNPNTSGISLADNQIKWTPTAAGQYTFYVTATDESNLSHTISFLVDVYAQTTISNTSFTEGEVLDPIFTLSISEKKPIIKIESTSLKELFTPIDIAQDGISLSHTQFSSNDIYVSSNSGTFELEVSGAVKFAQSAQLSVVLHFSDGTMKSLSFPANISGKNLGYVKYDVFVVSSGSVQGTSNDVVIRTTSELARSFSGWKTPIFVRYKNTELLCNGSALTSYDASNTTHRGCVRDTVSPDAETIYFFKTVWRGVSRIGGTANGIRNGVISEGYPHDHVVAHELAHNLGLWHTFESFANKSLSHSDGSSAVSRKLYKYKDSDSAINHGDFLPYIIGYGTVDSFSFSPDIVDDTPIDGFNAKTVILNDPNNSNGIYINGDIVSLRYGGQSPTSSGYTCIQGSYNSATKTWAFSCNESSGITAAQSIINNIMSYWSKKPGETVFTMGQKRRMSDVLAQYPGITTR